MSSFLFFFSSFRTGDSQSMKPVWHELLHLVHLKYNKYKPAAAPNVNMLEIPPDRTWEATASSISFFGKVLPSPSSPFYFGPEFFAPSFQKSSQSSTSDTTTPRFSSLSFATSNTAATSDTAATSYARPSSAFSSSIHTSCNI